MDFSRLRASGGGDEVVGIFRGSDGPGQEQGRKIADQRLREGIQVDRQINKPQKIGPCSQYWQVAEVD